MRGNRIAVSCLTMAIIFIVGLNDARSAESKDVKQVTCTGKVVDEQDRPLADVKINLYKVAIETTALSYKIELARQSATRADGTFTIDSEVVEDQLSSQAIVLADKQGRALGWDNWRLTENADVEIVLGLPSVLTGTVVDENGSPIDGAEVGISFMLAKTGRQPRYLVGYSSIELLMTKSDSKGKFSFDRLPAGASAEFVVKKPGRATVSTFDPVAFGGGSLQFSAGQADIKITQPVEARIEGLAVEKSNGKPIGGLRIMAIRGLNQPTFGSEPVVSKEDGTFSIDRLAPGEYLLQVATALAEEADWICDPVKVDVEMGKTKNGIKVELVKGGVLEVLVTDSITRQPVDKAIVSIMPNSGGTGSGKSTDETGIARFRQMPGEYRISYLYKEGYSRQNLQEGTLMIEDGKTIRIERQLAGLPKIAGVIHDEQGRPVEGANVRICPMGGGANACISDAEGKFEASWDPGSWHDSQIPAMVLLARQLDSNLAAAMAVDENTRHVDVTLKPGVIFSGKVVNPNGKDIEGANVTVMLRGPRWGSSIGRDRITSDAQGRFEIKAVPSDQKYSLYVIAEGYGENRSEEISAYDAVNYHLDLGNVTLPVANLSVSGIVVDSDDKPVAGASLYCYGEGQSRSRTQTDADGKFTLEKVCAGRIRISADKPGATRMYGYIETEGGATDVRIVISERPTSTNFEPRRPPSFVGRPLPELKEVGVNLSPTDTDGKMLLVCFFDMEQRPSRHCVTQLAKQAEQFKNNGVIVIAVQATKVDQEGLNQWKNKYNIPFTFGMVQDDWEKARFTWGVRFLPWLILTDHKHIITAEGFGVAELDKRMKPKTDK